MQKFETAVIKLQDIKPADYNPRVVMNPQDQEYQALRGSIQENGLVLPLVVNRRDNMLISGHQRLNVLLAEGETETTAVLVDMPPALAEQKTDLFATGFTDKDLGELLGEIEAEINGVMPERLAKKADNSGLVRCLVGEYKFTLSAGEFEDLIAEVREKVGFTKLLVCEELKRRLFA